MAGRPDFYRIQYGGQEHVLLFGWKNAFIYINDLGTCMAHVAQVNIRCHGNQ